MATACETFDSNLAVKDALHMLENCVFGENEAFRGIIGFILIEQIR